MTCAVVTKKTGIIQNMVLALASDPWPDETTYLVHVPENLSVGIGHTYDGTNFIDFNGNVIIPFTEILSTK